MSFEIRVIDVCAQLRKSFGAEKARELYGVGSHDEDWRFEVSYDRDNGATGDITFNHRATAADVANYLKNEGIMR